MQIDNCMADRFSMNTIFQVFRRTQLDTDCFSDIFDVHIAVILLWCGYVDFMVNIMLDCFIPDPQAAVWKRLVFSGASTAKQLQSFLDSNIYHRQGQYRDQTDPSYSSQTQIPTTDPDYR